MALRTLYNPGALIAYQTSFSTFRLTFSADASYFSLPFLLHFPRR